MTNSRGNDSRIGEMTRSSVRNEGIIDALEQLGGRVKPIQTPPFNPRQGGPAEPAPDVPDVPADPTIRPTPQAPQMVSMTPANLNAIANSTAVEDRDFYTQTGRNPTQVDKALMEARRRILVASGRMPTPQELVFEAQRGLIQTPDNNVSRL